MINKKAASLKRFFSKTYLDRWILLLVSIGSFLPWVKFQLSGGISPFNLHSPLILSWGLLFLPMVILTIIRSKWFLFFLLIIVFSFPLQINWNYILIQDAISEIRQKDNIKQFADKYVYEPNIGDEYGADSSTLSFPDISDLWDNPWSRVLLTVESLGVGFWMAFIGILIVSRRLGKRRFIIALSISIILSLPAILTASFLTMGKSAFLRGDYSQSANMYKRAMRINQSFIGNKTLGWLEPYYVWVGRSLFYMGVKDAPEVYFFLGNNQEGVSSFIESKEMYERAMSLSPARKALARAITKEALADFREKGFGSAMERIDEALRLDAYQFEALFYASYISFILKDQQLTLYYSGLLFNMCKERLLFSDLYNIIGDTYQKTGSLPESRAMYRKSVDTFDKVKNGNYHAWVGIAGW